jgi:hypothetical protein
MLRPDPLVPVRETQADSQNAQTAVAPEHEDAQVINSLAHLHIEARPSHISPYSFLKSTNNQQPRDDYADSNCGNSYAGSSNFYGPASESIYQYRLENGRTYHAVRRPITKVGSCDADWRSICIVLRWQYVFSISFSVNHHEEMLLTIT